MTAQKKKPILVEVEIDKELATKLGTYKAWCDLQGGKKYIGEDGQTLHITARENLILQNADAAPKYRLVNAFVALNWAMKNLGYAKVPAELIRGLL